VHAAEIIDKCFTQHEEFALQVLTTKSKLYFDYSPLELGTETNSRSFLASKCVQKYLGKLWYGDINQHGFHQVHINLLVGLNATLEYLLIDKLFRSLFCVFFLFSWHVLGFLTYSNHRMRRERFSQTRDVDG
jgi:hypothetical protein